MGGFRPFLLFFVYFEAVAFELSSPGINLQNEAVKNMLDVYGLDKINAYNSKTYITKHHVCLCDVVSPKSNKKTFVN